MNIIKTEEHDGYIHSRPIAVAADAISKSLAVIYKFTV